MSNVISSAIFCARNVDKAENQDKVGRWAVAAGQAKKIADYVTTLDNSVGKEASATIDLLKKYSKEKKVLGYAGKAINLASENVNPLICVSAGLDVLNAKDKDSAVITNATALAAMFAVEDQMKKHLDEIPKISYVKKAVEKFKTSKVGKEIVADALKFAERNKSTKAIPAIVHGTAFVVGSCTAYNVGEKFGKLLARDITGHEDGNEKQNKKAASV